MKWFNEWIYNDGSAFIPKFNVVTWNAYEISKFYFIQNQKMIIVQ